MNETGTFLSPAEIKKVTGRSWPSLQIQYLAAKGWPFEIDDFNRPVVLRSVMERKLSGNRNAQQGFTLDEATIA